MPSVPEELKSGDNTFGSVFESGEVGNRLAERSGEDLSPEAGMERSGEQGAEKGPGKLTEILQKTQSVSAVAAVAHDDDTEHDARNISLLSDVEGQVTRLLDLVTQKGISHAVTVARKMKNYYILDRMHDDLVDKFYQGLVDRGVIEKE